MYRISKLKPCPRCKSTDIGLYNETFYAYCIYYYECGLKIREPYEFKRFVSVAKTKYEREKEKEDQRRAKDIIVNR